MTTKFKFILLILIFGAVSLATLCFLLTTDIAVLDPKGWVGVKERELLLISIRLMFIVVIPVVFLTFWIAWKYRAENKKAKHDPEWDYNLIMESIYWGIPFIIIVVLAFFTWKGCHELDPFKPLNSNTKPLRIQAIALQWKWLFIYPEQEIATVNFIQFPKDTPIDFEISADAPMNSFWIPELGGQIYAMSGMRSKLHLITDREDTFRGCSANISGKGFSGMTFVAKSSSEEDFHNWVESVKESATSLDLDSYNDLVAPSEYNKAAFYVLGKKDLFEWIVMKYMMPMDQGDGIQ